MQSASDPTPRNSANASGPAPGRASAGARAADPGAVSAGHAPVTLIAAMAHARVIGRDNRMPWHLPADLAHFRRLTLDRPILMGRRTWESLPSPLPRRRAIVISRDPAFVPTGCEVARSPAAALALAAGAPEVCVVGGAQVYAALLPLATRLELTLIDADIPGDTCFPRWEPADWQAIACVQRPADAANPFALDFVTLVRRARG